MLRQRTSPFVKVAIIVVLLVPALPLQVASADGTPWYAEYYGNTDLVGPAVLARNEAGISYDWGEGSPGGAVPSDNFSVRWTTQLTFAAGDYVFTTTTDDGVRLYIDGTLVIDYWNRTSRHTATATVGLSEGAHTLRMEYFEWQGTAYASLSWSMTTVARGGNILTCLAPPGVNSWIKVYRWESGAWVDINPHGWGPINTSGFLKIDGMPVDMGIYGGNGHPYKVELYVNGSLVASVGDTSRGEPAFRVYPGADSGTPWACPISY